MAAVRALGHAWTGWLTSRAISAGFARALAFIRGFSAGFAPVLAFFRAFVLFRTSFPSMTHLLLPRRKFYFPWLFSFVQNMFCLQLLHLNVLAFSLPLRSSCLLPSTSPAVHPFRSPFRFPAVNLLASRKPWLPAPLLPLHFPNALLLLASFDESHRESPPSPASSFSLFEVLVLPSFRPAGPTCVWSGVGSMYA
eukprot:2027707-Pleurochrysis_carterae.AAC.1